MINIDRINQITTSWAQFAPEKTYCNLTLAAATSAFQPVFDVRQELMEADIRYTALMARRDTVDAEANDLMLRIVNAVKAEPNGENSEVYRGMGYKTKNERANPGPRTSTTTPSLSASSNGSVPITTTSGNQITTLSGSPLVTIGGLSARN
jgi:activator of HSP90 ATPase